MSSSNPLEPVPRSAAPGTPEMPTAPVSEMPPAMYEAETFRPQRSDDATIPRARRSANEVSAVIANLPEERRQAIWARLKADSAAYSVQQNELWCGVDETMLARFLTGQCAADEKLLIESALRESEALQQCLALLSNPTPATLTVPMAAVSGRSTTSAASDSTPSLTDPTPAPKHSVTTALYILIVIGIVAALIWFRFGR